MDENGNEVELLENTDAPTSTYRAEMGDDSDENDFESGRLAEMGFSETTLGEEDDDAFEEEYAFEEDDVVDDFGSDDEM